MPKRSVEHSALTFRIYGTKRLTTKAQTETQHQEKEQASSADRLNKKASNTGKNDEGDGEEENLHEDTSDSTDDSDTSNDDGDEAVKQIPHKKLKR